MPQVLSVLFGAGFTVLVCLAIGRVLLRRLGIELYRLEEGPLALVIGGACLSWVVFLVCVLQLAYEATFLIIGAAALAMAWRSGAHKAPQQRFEPLSWPWRALMVASFAFFGVLYLANAVAPEMSPDGSTYHLGLVGRYFREHGFVRITTNLYANLSQGVDLLYLFAYSFGRQSSAAVVHFAYLIALTMAILSYARRFGFVAAGVVGALFFFLSPVVGKDGTTAYNDVAVAAVVFTVFYLLQLWSETRRPGLIVPIGLAAGFCYAAKYTAFLAVPYAVVFLFWKLWRDKKPFLKPLVVFSLCALVMIVPWMAKNWIWLDNPFSPFFNRIFPNPYVHIAFEEGYSEHLRNYREEGLESHWDIPLELTVRGSVLRGHMGPLFLLSPLALFALRKRQGRKLLLASLIFGSVYVTNIGTRFLIPALPFLSLALAMVFMRIPPVAYVLVLLHGFVSWPDIAKLYTEPYAFHLDRVEWKAALRIESEEGWLRRKFPGYVIARMVAENVPPGDKVLTFNQVAEAYTNREAIVVYQSAFGEVLGDILWTPPSPHYQATRQIRFQFPAGEYRKLRVVQTASHHFTNWSVTEMRFFEGGAELPRTPGWRLQAHPNPWDVQFAFDNSGVTRWRTWEAIWDGMYIEADFGEPRDVDSVVLESSGDQWDIRLRLEGMDSAGNWAWISEETIERANTPSRGLRREATRELKHLGIRYLLVFDSDYYYEDYLPHLQEWGITQVANEGEVRLYRID